MQAAPVSYRPPPSQRRSPEPNPHVVPQSAPPVPPSASQSSIGTRASSGSGKPGNPGKKKDQLSQIEKSVTHLLIATKQLLETLTQWSRHTATEAEVSDVYVRLGYEFNIACRAFTSIGVDTTDLGPVPDLLRQILEETLSQEASPASLDKFLPRIRDIIINLLHGLKRKQQRLRARQAKEAAPTGGPGRQLSAGSIDSSGSGNTGLTQLLEDVQPQNVKSRMEEKERERSRRGGSGGGSYIDDRGIPARSSSVQTLQESGGAADSSPTRSGRRQPPPSLSDSSLSSETMQNIPVLSPDTPYTLPIQRMSIHDEKWEAPPPPPPPKQQDALAALQRGGDLERRASRRFSAYQISKHLGASPGGVPMLPPQNSPIPNRGRDVRESLNAVRTRGSMLPSRQRSTRLNDVSPSRGTPVSKRISEEPTSTPDSVIKTQIRPAENDSPMTKTPEDKLGPSFIDSNGEEHLALTGTLNGPLGDNRHESQKTPKMDRPSKGLDRITTAKASTPEPVADEQFIPEQSPQPGKELTLFLQYKSKIKKFVLPDGLDELTVGRLQLAFIEKFAWNTHSNGLDLPDIYIQDPVSGVRHELEDLSDIKDRCVLALNVEVLDEVKKQIDEGLGGIRKLVEGVRAAVDGQKAALTQVTQAQRDTAHDVARIASAPPIPPPPRSPAPMANGVKMTVSPNALTEVKTLRRDLAVMRQTFTSFSSGITASMGAIRAKAESVKVKSIDTAIPVLDGESGRAYVNTGKKAVGDESESIVNRVDDLQDIVEDLRKDVVTRGVRPLPRQLETVSKDISDAKKELKKMQDHVRSEKPIWTKIWEKELETVCNDREFLTMQEELIADLEDDLEKANQTFSLVEQATKEQNIQASQPAPISLRNVSRGLSNLDPSIDPVKAKDGVLGEVRALQPNHETRLEAIERAEKARQKELESRSEGAAFKKELGSFVEEGRLRKSGGVEEAERLRKAMDERNMKGEWDDQQTRKAARAKARAEERAKQAAAAQQATENPEAEEEAQEGDEELQNGVNSPTAIEPGEEAI